MTSYGEWQIGGHSPSNTLNASFDLSRGQITLQCVALKSMLDGQDPMTEIAYFDAMSSEEISSTSLINGGVDIQALNESSDIPITDGRRLWYGNVARVKCKVDSWGNDSIEYDLVLNVKMDSKTGSFVYLAPFYQYRNISYWEYTDHVDYTHDPNAGYGNEIGDMYIYESSPVKQVKLVGSGCILPASITCNEQTWNWRVSQDNPSVDPTGFEQVVFDFPEGVDVLHLNTSEHTMYNNHGCWLDFVKVLYL